MEAYVDESCRTTGAVSCYVMAAVLVPPERAHEVREVLRMSVRRGLRRFHWHSEGDAARRAMAEAVRGLDLRAVVVAERAFDGRKAERARRRCLMHLLWELGGRAVGDVVLESRSPRLDADDRQVIAASQRAGIVAADVRYAFARPGDETLLWPPDVVAGAVSLALDADDQRYLDMLGGCVEVVTLA